MKLQCLIIDDEPVARKIIREYIEEIEFLEFQGEFENPLKASGMIHQNQTDIIFLDINMPSINGIDFLKVNPIKASIIMTTAYSEYAIQAFGLDVMDYLLKPISIERFLKSCNKVKDYKEALSRQTHISEKTQNYFFVKCNNLIEKVLYDDLIYAEAMLNYIMLYTETKKLMVYLTIKALEEQLPSSQFIKVHKSFLVNMNKIKSLEGNLINLGNIKITISQSLREKVIKEVIQDKMLKR